MELEDVMIRILIAVALLICGVILGAGVEREDMRESICIQKGFDGATTIEREPVCFTACPFELVVSGECTP